MSVRYCGNVVVEGVSMVCAVVIQGFTLRFFLSLALLDRSFA